jgi:hypothetical protein
MARTNVIFAKRKWMDHGDLELSREDKVSTGPAGLRRRVHWLPVGWYHLLSADLLRSSAQSNLPTKIYCVKPGTPALSPSPIATPEQPRGVEQRAALIRRTDDGQQV